MSVRHQIYTVLPDGYIAMHFHPWLWGAGAMLAALSIIRLFEAGRENSDGPLSEDAGYLTSCQAIANLLSVNRETGAFRFIHKQGFSGTLDPVRQDNDSGITVVDLSRERPSYCFAIVSNNHFGDEAVEGQDYVAKKPISALDWARLHYRGEANREECGRLSAASNALLKYNVLSVDQFEGLFPLMYCDADMVFSSDTEEEARRLLDRCYKYLSTQNDPLSQSMMREIDEVSHCGVVEMLEYLESIGTNSGYPPSYWEEINQVIGWTMGGMQADLLKYRVT